MPDWDLYLNHAMHPLISVLTLWGRWMTAEFELGARGVDTQTLVIYLFKQGRSQLVRARLFDAQSLLIK